MTAYKLVIFDFDGTLADSAPWFIQTLSGLTQRHSFRQVSATEIEHLRDKPNREIINYRGVRFWQMPAIARDVRARSAEAADQIPQFDGFPNVLAAIKENGIHVANVGSISADTIRRIWGPSAHLIDRYGCGASLFGKVQKFRKLLRALRLILTRCSQRAMNVATSKTQSKSRPPFVLPEY
ncbi:HAD hydrolase-like protein [Devosia sp. MC1541]|uniref:HAD hydrolase-like protein n=1 Tax=Devosia sp. MC1541 TaxID=2725264 RepID=UPI0020C1173B|nr:HAD hydrolase-like protein [Devosia sp. MC1541]